MATKRLLVALVAVMAFSGVASAEPVGASVVAPAGNGQQALAVRAGSAAVLAKVCPAAAGCNAEGGTALDVPPEVGPLVANARVAVVKLAGGKSLVRVDVDGARPGAKWVMLVAAPAAGSAPTEVWNGWTGASKGEHGEGRTHVLLQEKASGGAERFVLAQRRDDVSICGRQTLVAAKELDTSKMKFEGPSVFVDNLDALERGKAVKLFATRTQNAAPVGIPLLKATAASSAVDKKFAALTDGDPATGWSENRADGRGEFVSMSSASEVGVTGFELRIRPSAEVPNGAAPKRFFLATEDKLFEITMPEDAWNQPDARYEVKLPNELHAACVTLVLEDSYTAKAGAEARVTVAEVTARTVFDGTSLEALVGALAGGGPRAQGAAALLARGGAAATKATIAGYPSLDEAGKLLAMSVIDGGTCADQMPFFAERLVALAGKKGPAGAVGRERQPRVTDTRTLEENELAHTKDRMRRCRQAAAPTLAKLVAEAPGAAQVIAASELALVAPAEAVPVLLDAIGKAKDAPRRELRTALAHAAVNERAWPALAAELEPAKLSSRSPVTQIDLLRALGPSIGRVQGAGRALAELTRPNAEFRTRYLLLAPAADLARSGDPGATEFLRASLRKDADVHVRARAAELSVRVAPVAPDLVAAVEDTEPRVRDAAAVALAFTDAASARPASQALLKRLKSDPWTFVRASSARSIGALPAEREVDRALAAALRDASPDVRGQVVDALGAHRALDQRGPVRERADDPKETLEVRARAIVALGEMCDVASAGTWTTLAQRLAAPQDERDRRLGAAAVSALGQLHPTDLKQRLEPLLGKNVPPGVRELAREAIAAKGGCR